MTLQIDQANKPEEARLDLLAGIYEYLLDRRKRREAAGNNSPVGEIIRSGEDTGKDDLFDRHNSLSDG